jgi:hypothetical protein
LPTNKGRRQHFLHCTILRHTAVLAEEETMTSAMTAFAIAVGTTSLVCYALMTRLQNRPSRIDSGGFHGGGGDFGGGGGDGGGGDGGGGH